ncbi:Rieske (2Fe-2S) protein [Baekduia soli]|uniref:Rieske (2Fe-2S) protein n=1 Tax=Baekduia soli TaxID=496014 RepID=A0A5B8TZK2_9ACTN|nr:Rieske (2Fe-2S) protein [Baekduia soli]QEC46161.1 Rieske (2Fe-2S) protein [Baekduia soli]
MGRHVVAKASDLPEGGRIIVEVQGRSIGVFHINGRFHALLNQCPHMGAELCRGSILGRLDSTVPGEFRYDEEHALLRCPWHGWEYDIETGQSYFDSRARPYPVDVRAGGEVAPEVQTGDVGRPAAGTATESVVGLAASKLRPGPYVAESFPIAIEDDYIVVTMPGRARPAPRPAEEGG